MKLALAVGALAASGTLVALTTPAQADPPDHAQARGVVSHSTGADTKAEQREVRRYWTAKRMRNATPREAIRPSAKPSGNAKPTKPGGSTSDPSLGSIWTNTDEDTVGKVFFTLGGTDYVCSGNSVDWSGDGDQDSNIVSTAGHCVSDGDGKFASNFSFAPAYDGTATNSTPKGEFVATKLTTSSQWDAQGTNKWDYDFAVATVGSLGGETLEGTVGSTDIDFRATDPNNATTPSIAVHSFGYPAARPYDGRQLAACWNTTTRDTVGGSGDYRLRCNLTGGSSGGPWLQDDPANPFRVGTVQVSVNSFSYRGEKNAMYGPLLGPTARAVYLGAGGVSGTIG